MKHKCFGTEFRVRKKHPPSPRLNPPSRQAMHNVAVGNGLGNAHGARRPGKRPILKGSQSGDVTLSGRGRGFGTRRALPDATFFGPFRAETRKRVAHLDEIWFHTALRVRGR